jgi:hypothetical protein
MDTIAYDIGRCVVLHVMKCEAPAVRFKVAGGGWYEEQDGRLKR